MRIQRKPSLLALGAVAGAMLLIGAAPGASARPVMVPGSNQPGPGGMVTLPYNVTDKQGNVFIIYQYGQFQQQGNMPVYSQAAMLQINGSYVQARNNQARLDEKTGELLLENLPAQGGVTLTRRILFNKDEGWIRYIDILKNTGNQEVTPTLVFNTNLNYGVQSATTVEDPKRRDQVLAWVAQTNAGGRTCVEMFGGKGAKSVPQIQYQPGNSNINVNYSPPIAAGKQIAIMHFHMIASSPDAGQKFVLGLKESKIMASIPAAIRRLIVNFRGGENFIGDYEILRGDLLDVVELRSGDQLRGTLKEKDFKLRTFYGPVDLAVNNVIGLINVGEFRPRQLVVTGDGEIFGGQLDHDRISLELSSGQLTEIPISQITRVGYRKRAGEPEEWTFDKPIVLMRTGDRIEVKPPTKEIDVATRYGALHLAVAAVAAIDFESEEHGVHEIHLTDGSKFAGLVNADLFEMKLQSEGPEQVVKFPASSIRRLQLAVPPDGDDPGSPVAELANEDSLVGVIQGQLKLDTAFSTLVLNGPEIKRLVKMPGAPSDVQVVLWDDTTVTGQLQEQDLAIRLKCGIDMKVPVALLKEYNQPRPAPSKSVVQTITQLVAALNAEDWKQRDAAQEKLTQMGIVTAPTLRELRSAQTPEAQQRIDQILKSVEKDAVRPRSDAPEAPNVLNQ